MSQTPLQLTGIHHLTAITGNVSGNYDFYASTLGLRLVKKTVNQDDVSAYHLFYADGKGSPGTDLTFFDWPAPPERRGTHSIVRTGLRVASAESLKYWAQRLSENRAGEVAQMIGQRLQRQRAGQILNQQAHGLHLFEVAQCIHLPLGVALILVELSFQALAQRRPVRGLDRLRRD